MARILKIYKDTDPELRVKCNPVLEITPDIRDLAENMELTMMMANGSGLAANQVGETCRLIFVKGPSFKGVMVNPEIKWCSEEKVSTKEGCLSLPGQSIEVSRNEAIRVSYVNLEGEKRSLPVDDFTAIIIQHEIDHLNGIMINDYLGG